MKEAGALPKAAL